MGLKVKKDKIKEFYYDGLENIQSEINIKEYKKISKKIRKIESDIFENSSKENRERIETYMEYITERESIQAEHQYKVGFKTAIKLMLEVFDKE